MTEPMMWLLLFLAAALAVLVAALTRTRFTTRKIAMIGIMAALSLVAYEFFRIPDILGSGSSFHLGNTFTALTAMLLDGVSGGLAGAIGLSLADIMAGDPGYAVTTFLLKFIIGLVCGFFAHRIFRLETRDRKTDRKGYLIAVICSAFSGLLVNVFTDPFLGYFRNRYIFGQQADLASAMAKVTSGVTLVNSLLSTVCAVVIYLALRPALERAHLLEDPEMPRRKS
ncbi:MAG: ECF transporter S component [Gemmiger sp.]|uniref:ECF transporter S component n=1 Tax=Gemmiger sp. TaxID=2049027 RepID=UPI002E775D40|nr:ECF transporter S component [Gemmiger sp.]MEE0800852.1 ECF transporter S component [Gemmiger sp.]